VLFKSAFLQDARAIIERAHEVGAMVVLDTYQSAGTIPFSVKELDADFATGGSVKWLCGGPGAGYLYVRPDLQTILEPKTTGWMAHEAPFAFDTELRYAPNITRFLHGSPAIPALYAAQSGYKIVNAIGVDNIREKSVRQTSYRRSRIPGYESTRSRAARRHRHGGPSTRGGDYERTDPPRVHCRLPAGRRRAYLATLLHYRRRVGTGNWRDEEDRGLRRVSRTRSSRSRILKS
jgi:kynureninase